jgi:hypothetical protein
VEILALEPEVGRVHLNELPDEDPRTWIGLALKAFQIGDGGSHQVIHELEFAANGH